MAHQPTSPKTYALIYVLLLGLTATTVWIANTQNLGSYEIPVALGIASTKTLLVALYFMHMLHSPKLTWVAMGIGVVFLIAMIVMTLGDYWTRGWMAGP